MQPLGLFLVTFSSIWHVLDVDILATYSLERCETQNLNSTQEFTLLIPELTLRVV